MLCLLHLSENSLILTVFCYQSSWKASFLRAGVYPERQSEVKEANGDGEY